jgi:curved DNA-binding protein CbpA
MVDYYNLLGVARTATEEQIRAAFRRAAKRCHPDAHAQGTPRQQAEAQQRFIQLAQAYETLSHVGLRRTYDEKLKAAPAKPSGGQPTGADARPGASTAKPKAPPSPAPNPAGERQQRADQARRPSAEGERQARMDESRRATERQAEHRQRSTEAERRERERLQREAQELASRQRRARAQAEAARTRTHGRPPRDRSLEELVDDVESLLGRFGLDLRTPVEVVWDTLLAWARRIFRDTAPPEAEPRRAPPHAEKPRPSRPQTRPRPEPASRAKAGGRPHAPPRPEPPPQAQPPPKPPPRPRATFRDEAEDAVFREIDKEPSVEQRAADLELERELNNLKRDVNSKPKNNASARTAEEEELAELKRRMGKE